MAELDYSIQGEDVKSFDIELALNKDNIEKALALLWNETCNLIYYYELADQLNASLESRFHSLQNNWYIVSNCLEKKQKRNSFVLFLLGKILAFYCDGLSDRT